MRVIVALVLLAAASITASAQRLPAGVTPEHYTLWFAPDLDTATFRGRAVIEVRLDAAASAVTLHAAEIAFGKVEIDAGGAHPDRQRAPRREDRNRHVDRGAADGRRPGHHPHRPTPASSTTSCAAST